MRGSVHDLISLGPGPAYPQEAGKPARASRTRDRAADSSHNGETTSFNLLLAMAALHQPAEQFEPPANQSFAIGGTVDSAPQLTTWRGRIELPESRHAERSAGAATVSREQWGARIHNLFESIAADAPGEDRPDSPAQSALELVTDQGADRQATSLTIVARNDRPSGHNSSAQATQPANLRIIYPDGSISRPHLNLDLVERLAETWRHAFSEVAAPDGTTEQPQGSQTSDVLAGVDLSPATHVEAGTPYLRDLHGDAGRFMSDESGSSERDEARIGRAESGRAATVVPLFGELVTAESQRVDAPADNPVTARRAVTEIAGETFRLEQTGGSELSFTMKLMPEHLGEIEIDIQRVDDRWTISITASGDAARDALAAEIHRLERALREHDLTLSSVSVVTRDPEPALSAPQSSEQSARPDWFGNQNRHFGSNGNWDESGRHASRPRGTIGIDSGHGAGMETQLATRRASNPLAGIDIQA